MFDDETQDNLIVTFKNILKWKLDTNGDKKQDFKIMKSPAGYYIGKDCQVVYGDETITEPYDRFTDYYPTKTTRKC